MLHNNINYQCKMYWNKIWSVRYNSVFVPLSSPNTCKGVFNQHFSQIAPRICILMLFIRNRNVYTKITEAGSRFNTEGGGDTFRFTSHTYVRYASQIMQPICKICVLRFGKKRVAILWVRQAQNTVLRRFLPNTPQFGKKHRIPKPYLQE